MSVQTAKEESSYTYEDYSNFPDDFGCEIINGQIYDMIPCPTARHPAAPGEFDIRESEQAWGER